MIQSGRADNLVSVYLGCEVKAFGGNCAVIGGLCNEVVAVRCFQLCLTPTCETCPSHDCR